MAELVTNNPNLILKKKKQKKMVIIAAAVLLLGGAGAYAYQGRTANQSVASTMQIVKVMRGDVIESITASGTVQASKRVSIESSNSSNEMITSIQVKVGDKVKAGQVLANLDDSEAKLAVSNAQANLLTAQAQLAELEQGPTTAELALQEASVKKASLTLQEAKNTYNDQEAMDKLEQAKRDWQIAQKDAQDQKILLDEGAISQSEYNQIKQKMDQAELAYKTAERQYQKTVAQSKQAIQEAEISYQSAVIQLNQLKNPPKASSIQSAKASVQKAEAELEQQKIALSKLQIVAPMDGVILEVNGEVGSKLKDPLIVMDNSDSQYLEVLAQVSQSDIGKIKLGQKATLTTSSFEGKTFNGKVSMIYPEAITDSGVTMYRVLLSVDNSSGNLMTGMNMSVAIEAGKHENVLYIPASALREQGGKDGVFLSSKSSGKKQGSTPSQFQPITIGYYTAERVEVTSGLKEGDSVVISFQNSASSSENARSNRVGGGFPGGGIPGMGGGMRRN